MIHSLLFVPAVPKMLGKIEGMTADAYVIDLEDSIPVDQKDAALDTVCEWLAVNKHKNIYVRLNKERYAEEARSLSTTDDVGYMLPKFESPDEYEEGNEFWVSHDVIALIETPLGIVNLNVAASCEWVNAFAFGAEDYTSELGLESARSQEHLVYPKSALVTYGKAFNKRVFDTPCFEIRNEDIIKEQTERSLQLGFDGKLAIHPTQVKVIEQVFGTAQINKFRKIVECYEHGDQAVQVIDGQVYEKMHIAQMKRKIAESEGKQ